jgi:hypothetical protein
MSRKFATRGMVLPLSLLAILAVLGLVTTLGGLNQGLRTQIYRTNNHQLSFLIAYSAFSRVCAKIHSFSWANRPFLTEPYTETRIPLQGGHYDLLVENTAGKDYQADIYIRTHLANISRMYFWRIRFNDDLLDVSNNIIVELYATPEVDDFPTVNGPRKIAGEVEEMLAKRSANQKKSDAMASELMKSANTRAIIEKMGARVPVEFQQELPVTAAEEMMETRTAVEPPDLQAPLVAEKPTAPGPSPSYLGISNDSMSGNQINELSAKLTAASEKLVEATDKAWTEIDENGVDGIPAATEQWEAAAEAKEETFETLGSLIDESKAGIAEAPSAAAREAIEEMVAQTVVSSMNDIAIATERGYEHLVTGEGSYLEGLTTSAAVESLLNDWKAAEERTQEDLDKLTEMAGDIQGYSMTAEVSQKLADTLTSAQESLEKIQAAVAEAEARLAELRELEALAASELAAANADAEETAEAEEAAAVSAAAEEAAASVESGEE